MATQPIRQDLTCYKGQTYSQNIYFQYKATHQPIPLDGITGKSQIRPSDNSQTLTAEFTITIYAEEGKVNLSLDAETTAAIAPGSYAYDLKFTDSSDRIGYWIKGQFIVNGRVTV